MKNAIITLFEYEKHSFTWNDSNLRAIHDFKTEFFKLTAYQGQPSIQATQYVGIFKLGKQLIEVLPKLYQYEGQNIQQQARKNLLYLLEYTVLSFLKSHSQPQLLEENLNWLELITRLFAISLQQQLEKASYCTYQSFEGTLPILKGKWRLNEQLRHPLAQHKFCVSYDQFTMDNDINRVFRYV
ncbi:MAG: hypothetical protein AB4058_01635, partial [Microcystaceae cyanobacterium]